MKKQVNKKGIVSIIGGATYDETTNNYSFEPLTPRPGLVESFRRYGTAQQMSDGHFEFIPERRSHDTTTKIKKLPHGRLTINQKGYVRLTLTLEPEELLRDYCATILAKEACNAANALTDYLCMV